MLEPAAPVAAYTSFTYSYLSRALTWLRSLRCVHPDWQVYACIVDLPPDNVDCSHLLAEFDEIVTATELGIPAYQSWIFKHDIIEACTAVKGAMLQHLLQRGHAKVVYFDPDIAMFNPVHPIVDSLDQHSIVLTPHQSDPNASSAFADNELTSMKYGIFNLGFLAIRNDETGRAFAAWWAERLHHACYDDVANGIFTDQKYCDLVPGLFPRVLIDRDPGCNLASWNLSTRTVAFTPSGDIEVNASPLKFYHFTKINSEGDVMTERYAGENTEAIEIWNWYRRTIRSIDMPTLPKSYWHYARFSNGQLISKSARMLFRQREDLMQAFANPFDVEGHSYHGWLQREQPECLAEFAPHHNPT